MKKYICQMEELILKLNNQTGNKQVLSYFIKLLLG